MPIDFSFNKLFVYVFLSIAVFSLPALATLTAAGNSTAPSYVNTNQTVAMINLTLSGNVNVTGINITFNGTAGIGNVSQVLIYNDTNSDAAYDSGDILLGNSTFSNVTNTSYVSLNLNVSGTSKLLVTYKIHNSATRFVSVKASLTSNSSITSNETVSAFSINSSSSQIQDLRALASVSPSYVDTNVINQSFVYEINRTGNDLVKNISIVIPSQYSIVQLSSVKRGSTVLTGVTDYTNTTTGGKINISLVSSTTENLTINFTLDTNSSAVSSLAFNSTITGEANISDISTDVSNLATNVTTKQLINVDNVQAIKNTALSNGTDYWEFNFTLNITANVSGLIQFKMNNWNNSAGQIMNLTNQTSLINATFYASLRKSDNSTNTFNVTNHYNLSNGVSVSAGGLSQIVYVVLRMVIPSGTPITSDWWTTYWMLFRSTPS